jgi:type IV secretion system protein VirB9
MFLLSVLAVVAQEQQPASTKPAQTGKRNPKPKSTVAVTRQGTGAVPIPSVEELNRSIAALDGGSSTGQASALQSSAPNTSGDGYSEAPKNFKPRTDVQLPAGALAAVRLSDQWAGGGGSPTAGRDGRVVYTYGEGLPTLVCAPLRVCVLELQPGERLVGEPQIGDSVRWNVAPTTAGQGELATALLVVKPKAPGLDTNLVVTTDRRAYYVRLMSKTEEYTARVAFDYPDETKVRWEEYMTRQKQRERETREASRISEVAGVDSIYLDYQITGGVAWMKPLRAFDDGAKTYIQMPAAAAHRELPALVVVDADGKPEMVNYRVKNEMYVVDRLFERGALLLGAGKKQYRVEIVRGTYKGDRRENPWKSFKDIKPLAGASEK